MKCGSMILSRVRQVDGHEAEPSHRHSLNNPSRVVGSGVAAGHGGCAHAGRSAEADVTSGSEQELGRPVQHRMSAFGVARAVVTPLWTCRTGLSGHGGSPPPWLDSLLNCNVVLVVQRTGMSVKDDDLDDRDLTGLYCPARDRPAGSDIPDRPVGFLVRMLALMRVIALGTPVVKLVMTMLWMWGRRRPCGLVWCSKEATTQCWGLTGENRVRPVPWTNSSTA